MWGSVWGSVWGADEYGMPVVTAPLGLSLPAASRFRKITVVTVAILAVLAAVLSFSGLRLLALQAGFPSELAWIFPLVIDGLVLTGSMGVIAATLTGLRTWYPWTITLIGVVASVVGNVASAPPDLLSQAVHAAPPIVFALSIEGLLRVYRVGAVALVLNQEKSINTLTKQEELLIERGEKPIQQEEVLIERFDTIYPSEQSLGSGSPQAPSTAKSQKIDDDNVDKSHNEVNTPVIASSSSGKTARERIKELLLEKPDVTGGEAARILGVDPSHARKILRDIRTKEPAMPSDSPVPPPNTVQASTDLASQETVGVEEDPFA